MAIYDSNTPMNSEGVSQTQQLRSPLTANSAPTFQQAIKIGKQLEDNYLPTSMGIPDYKQESFDENLSLTDLHYNIDDKTLSQYRGEVQPWYSDISRGLSKAGVLATTTALDGTIGTVVGLGHAAATGNWQNFVNNPMSRALQQTNNYFEQLLPVYESKEQEESPWYAPTNIFSTNFIGDKLIKNAGFIAGAAATGRLYSIGLSKALQINKVREAFKGAVAAANQGQEIKTAADAYKAYREGQAISQATFTKELATAAKNLKQAEFGLKAAGSIGASIGEARIEGLGAADEYRRDQNQNLDNYRQQIFDDKAKQMYQDYPELFEETINENGEQTLVPSQKISDIINSEIDQEYNFQEYRDKIEKQSAKVANNTFALNMAVLPMSEYIQFGKFFASGYNNTKRLNNIAGNIKDGYKALEPNKLVNAARILKNPLLEGNEEMLQASVSTSAQLTAGSEFNSFVGAKVDPNAEADTVSLINGLAKGVLYTYGDIDNWEEGFVGAIMGGLGVPMLKRSKKNDNKFSIGMAGGIWDDINEIKQQNVEAKEIVDQLNNRIQDPKFVDFYQGLTRHQSFQNKMNKALNKDDIFEFKNAEDSQMFSDIAMFDKAGRIQELVDMVEGFSNIPQDQIEGIKEATIDPQTNKSLYEGLTDEEVINLVQDNSKKLSDKIDQYKKITRDIQTKYGDRYTQEEQDELAWMFSKIDSWETRFKDLHTQLQDRLKTQIAIEPSNPFKSQIEDMINSNPEDLMVKFMEFPKEVTKFINNTDKAIQGKYNLYKQDFIKGLNDLARIALARTDFLDKYSEYIYNPIKLSEKIAEQKKKAQEEAKKQEQKDNTDLFDKLKNIQGQDQLKQEISSIDSYNEQRLMLGRLSKEGNQAAKQLYDIYTYKDKIEYELRKTLQGDLLANTKKLLLSKLNSIDDVSQINNANTISFDRLAVEDLPDDAFVNAEQSIREAINRVNKTDKQSKPISSEDQPLPEYDTKVAEYHTQEEINTAVEIKTDIDFFGENGDKKVNNPQDQVQPTNPKELNNENNRQEQRTTSVIKDYYTSIISQVYGEAAKQGVFVETNKRLPYLTPVYSYLKDKGAFDYVNSGQLKSEDKITFTVDPELLNREGILGFPILINKGDQIIGILPESNASSFPGLAELRATISKEWDKTNKDEIYKSPISTKVDSIIPGFTPLNVQIDNSGNYELQDEKPVTVRRKLSEVQTTPLLGLYTSGMVKVPNKEGINVVPPNNPQVGALYMLRKGPDGKYYPIRLSQAHFNTKDFNINDPIVQSTSRYKGIYKVVKKLSQITSPEDIFPIKKELEGYLFLDNIYIDYFYNENSEGIRIVSKDNNANTKFIHLISKDGQRFSTEKISQNILNALQQLDIPFNIPQNLLNTTGFNEQLAQDILFTNILGDITVGSGFKLRPILPNGKPSAENELSSSIKNNNTVFNGQEEVIPGIRVVIQGGKQEVYVQDNGDILDTKGQKINPMNALLLRDLAYIQQQSNNPSYTKTKVKGKYFILPNNKVIDITIQDYVTDATIVNEVLGQEQSIKDRIKDSKAKLNKYKGKLREVSSESYELWDKDQELAWLKKVLPNVSNLVQIHTGLINVDSKQAWGLFKDNLIIISDIANKGTVYHEAFHVVFDLFTDAKQKEVLYQEARSKFGNKSKQQLEEAMAEEFREYVLTEVPNKTLGRKIIEFFKSLYNLVINNVGNNLTINQFFYNINRGRYSSKNINTIIIENNLHNSDKLLKFAQLDTETQNSLQLKGYNSNSWDLLTKEEKEHAIKCAKI